MLSGSQNLYFLHIGEQTWCKLKIGKKKCFYTFTLYFKLMKHFELILSFINERKEIQGERRIFKQSAQPEDNLSSGSARALLDFKRLPKTSSDRSTQILSSFLYPPASVIQHPTEILEQVL